MISGEVAFLRTVLTGSLEVFLKFLLETLMALPGVKGPQTSFSLKEVKRASALPLDAPLA